jgi:hypothetical protein
MFARMRESGGRARRAAREVVFVRARKVEKTVSRWGREVVGT